MKPNGTNIAIMLNDVRYFTHNNESLENGVSMLKNKVALQSLANTV